jgi:CO/xanthine dehydrogenase Mo-binding subunit
MITLLCARVMKNPEIRKNQEAVVVTTFSVVGKSVPRGEGPEKVSGKSLYAADIALPGLLWGRVLRSPYAHARIVRIDTSRARQLPGVHAVLTAQDLPDRRVGRLLRDCPVLARDKVLFVGEKVAAVAAEDPDIAEAALLLIDVEYEALEAVIDPLEAMQDTAPVLHETMASYDGLPQPPSSINNVFAHNTWSKGDVEQGFAESDLVFEETYTTQLMHQGYIEPHACVVDIGADGRVQVWANNKGPFMLRDQLALVWDLPKEQIRVNPCSIGGDFGGKGSFMDVPLCYYLAQYAKRPVKIVMDYIQELMAGNPRHPAIITLKTGVMRDGRIWARQARTVFNSGAYGAFKPRVYLRGADHSGGPYRIPHVWIDSYMVYTNNIPCGHMRAPAKPQVTFAVEAHMDRIARELGMDPYAFRRLNVLQDGDTNPIGEAWLNIRADETLVKAAETAAWGTPKARPYVGRGMAISDQPPGAGESSATVQMDVAGRATLRMSLWDTGTGAHTILRQIVAETLTIPVEDVEVVIQDTDAVPFESGPGGSRVTYTSGQSALGAAEDLKEQLTVLAAEYLGSSADQVQLQGGQFIPEGDASRAMRLRDVAAQAVASMQRPLEGQKTYTAPPSHYTSYCAQVAEVEVDPETGQVTVNKIVSAHDIGTVLNPITHQGQIEGGIIQGLGYALMEEMGTENGQVSTLSLGDYKLPTMRDIPELVTVLLDPAGGPAPFASKGIGESSNTPVAAAIANAVTDAIGVPIMDLPITAEKVLRALQQKPQG